MQKDNNKNLLLKHYLDNLQVNVLLAAFTHCSETWTELDYVPDYNKFYLICDGEGWLKIGDTEYLPKPGELFLMPAGVRQSYSSISKNTFKKFWCHFTAVIGEVNLFDVIKTPYHVCVKNMDMLSGVFQEVIKTKSSDNITASLKVKSALLQIISFYLDNVIVEKINISTSSVLDKVNNILTYIEKNYNRNINVEELAHIVFLHPNYFIRFFKKHIGCSPIGYINKVRLEKTKSLLESTDLTVSEIAVNTGYNDISHYSKTFKKHIGFSPMEYRNICKKKLST